MSTKHRMIGENPVMMLIDFTHRVIEMQTLRGMC